MRIYQIVIMLGLMLTPACDAGDGYIATSSVADWDFIQSAGGITVTAPIRHNDGSWKLPVSCDISGLTTITRKPTSLNSALVVTDTSARVDGNKIHLIVVINSALRSKKTSHCTAVNLGHMKPGEYIVVYGDSMSFPGKPEAVTHQIGTVRID
jgi:hypothetical protein